MNPWIQNVSLSDIKKGFHIDPGPNAMLIQIVDPAMEFPTPKYAFREVHQFEFLDLEIADKWGEEFKVTREQAQQLVALLEHALAHLFCRVQQALSSSFMLHKIAFSTTFFSTFTYPFPLRRVASFL